MRNGYRDKFQLLILGFVAFVTSYGAHVVAVNLPAYAEQIGVGPAMIGLLIAVYDFAEIAAKPAFGFIADRKRMKVTMLLGIAVFSLASLAYFANFIVQAIKLATNRKRPFEGGDGQFWNGGNPFPQGKRRILGRWPRSSPINTLINH
jgi:MFS family permease